MRPTVLIVHTLGWPNATRLALAFHEADCAVHALSPRAHPLRRLAHVKSFYDFNPFIPLRSFRAAIETAHPDLIVPCDDWSIRLLHRLHQRDSRPGTRAAIERSLGRPQSYEIVAARRRLGEIAGIADVPLPRTALPSGVRSLSSTLQIVGFPAVVKRDHSSGGEAVSIVADMREAKRAYRRMTGGLNLARAVKRLYRGDSEMAFDALGGRKLAVSIQAFIPGGPANCAVACWGGEFLAGISVEVCAATGPTGRASVVRVIDSEDMLETARRIVGRLGLSGFCGFDFILEEGSGRAVLVEINPRATQISHLALGLGRDLPAALRARVANQPVKNRRAVTEQDLIALFPQELARDPASPFLGRAYHDLPREASALVEAWITRC